MKFYWKVSEIIQKNPYSSLEAIHGRFCEGIPAGTFKWILEGCTKKTLEGFLKKSRRTFGGSGIFIGYVAISGRF